MQVQIPGTTRKHAHADDEPRDASEQHGNDRRHPRMGAVHPCHIDRKGHRYEAGSRNGLAHLQHTGHNGQGDHRRPHPDDTVDEAAEKACQKHEGVAGFEHRGPARPVANSMRIPALQGKAVQGKCPPENDMGPLASVFALMLKRCGLTLKKVRHRSEGGMEPRFHNEKTRKSLVFSCLTTHPPPSAKPNGKRNEIIRVVERISNAGYSPHRPHRPHEN